MALLEGEGRYVSLHFHTAEAKAVGIHSKKEARLTRKQLAGTMALDLQPPEL